MSAETRAGRSAAAAPPDDLLAVVRAVRIESPSRYVLLGQAREAPAPEEGGAEGAAAPSLLALLETDLYVWLYSRLHLYAGHAAPVAPGDPLRIGQRDHANALSAVNSGRGTWEAGWRILSLEEDGRAAVRKDEVTFWVPPEGLRARRVAPGEPCRVRVGKELRNLVPGFYVAIGDGPPEAGTGAGDGDEQPGPLLRLYWHLAAEAAVPYMSAATALLNPLGIPFRTKVLADPGSYARADAGVLYIERRDFGRALPALSEIHRRVAPGLRPEVPLFARPLAPGLGAAEDPGDGTSFGQARCRTAAAGLWRAFRAGVEGEEERAAALAETFRAEGLDLANLHLAPGSRAVYELEPKEAVAGPARPRRRPPARPARRKAR